MSRLPVLFRSTLLIALALPSAATLAQTISINAVTLGETDSGTVDFVFTVSLAAPQATSVEVDYFTVDETATAGSDYIPAAGTVTIPAGQLSTTLTVVVMGDVIWEADESFKVELGEAPAGGGPPQEAVDGRGTIVNDDSPPAASVDDCVTLEGDSTDLEPGECVFTVQLSVRSSQLATFDFITGDLDAIAGLDYESTAGQVLIAPGDTAATVVVPVLGDDIHEDDETFTFNLIGATGAVFDDSQGLGTIQDNDPVPSLSIDDAWISEGDSGSTFMTFRVSLSAPSSQLVTVSFDTAPGTATGSVDYFNVSGQKFIPAGQTETTISVEVVGDTVPEFNETLFVNLISASNATIARSQGTGTILDDESTVVIEDISLPEGDSGTTQGSVTINLSLPSSLDVTVGYQTQDATATAGLDYIAAAGMALIPAGQTSVTAPVTVIGDLLGEGDELFTIELISATNTDILDPIGVVTITDDDPAVVILDTSVAEGDSGTTNMIFDVTLTPPAPVDVSVTFDTIDGTAVRGIDFSSVSGTAFIPAGGTGTTIGVPIVGDTLPELDETFEVTFTAISSGADIADGIAIGTIVNDDIAPTMTISDAMAVEGNIGTTTMEFFLDLSDGSQVPIYVQVATESATADESDYEPHFENVEFLPPNVSRSVFIDIHGDENDECDEELLLRIIHSTGGVTILDDVGIGTIMDDDALSCANPDGDCAADPACGGSDCSEGDPDTYPDAPEVNDGRDNQCPGDPDFGLVDEITGRAGFLNPNDRDEFSWPPQAGAVLYEVLRARDPQFSSLCALFTTSGTAVSEPQSLGVGELEFWMSRPLTPNTGDWGFVFSADLPAPAPRVPECF